MAESINEVKNRPDELSDVNDPNETSAVVYDGAPRQAAADDAAEPRPSLLAGLFRSLLLRLIVIGALVIVVLIVGSGLVLSTMKAQRNQPIPVDIYPNSQVISKASAAHTDSQVYATTDSVQQVLNFYADRLSRDDGNGCKKTYLGDKASEEPGKVAGRCVVSNSLLDASQLLSIKIDYEAAPNGQTGRTIITIERSWGG